MSKHEQESEVSSARRAAAAWKSVVPLEPTQADPADKYVNVWRK